MHTRASKALAEAFETRGAQAQLAERTKISQSRLSRLAKDDGGIPNLEIALRLAADSELPIPAAWWLEPPPKGRAKGRAA